MKGSNMSEKNPTLTYYEIKRAVFWGNFWAYIAVSAIGIFLVMLFGLAAI